MAYLKIIRPFNCLFVILSVLFGGLVHSSQINLQAIIAAAFSAVFIAAAGYVINDYFDLPIDKINKPERPLPSGKIKPVNAYVFALFLFAGGITLSFLTQNIYCVAIAILNTLLLFFYARFFKLTPLMGNLLVAYAAASTFAYGGLSNNNFLNSLIIAVFAFLFTLIRELIKDCEDIEGDSSFKAKTLAIILGKKKTIFLAAIPGLFMLLFIYYLFLNDLISNMSFLLLNVFVIIPLVIFFISLFRNDSTKNIANISKFMKADMLVLLITMWLGN